MTGIKAPILATLAVTVLLIAACGGGPEGEEWQLRSNAGVQLYSEGNLVEAEIEFSEAIRLNPESAMSFNNRGLVRSFQGRFDLAKADFDEALRLDPLLGMAFNNRGFANLNLGDFTKAVDDYDEAIRLNKLEPQTANPVTSLGPREQRLANAYLNRANAFTQLTRFQDAVTDLSEAIRVDPEFGGTFTSRTGALMERARVYLMIGQFGMALADLDEGISRDPASAELYAFRALVFIRLGDDEKSGLDVQRAMDLGADGGILGRSIEEARRQRSPSR